MKGSALPAVLDSSDAAAILAQCHEAIVTRDLQDRVLFWNLGAERLFGWRAAEVQGRDLREFLIAEPAAYARARQQLLADGCWQGDLRKTCADGSERIVECHWSLIRDASGQPTRIFATDIDVTHLRAIQSRLCLAALIFDEASEGFIVADQNGLIVNSNPALARMVGRPASQLVGQQVAELLLDDQGESLYPALASALDLSGRWQGSAQLRRYEGEQPLDTWVSVIAARSADGRQQLYTVLDISEQTEMRREIEYLSLYDKASGLPNRTLSEERLRNLLASARRSGEQILTCALRIEGLDQLMHMHGVAERDAALARIAAGLSAGLREGDLVGRIGDDSLLLIAESATRENIGGTLERWQTIARQAIAGTRQNALLAARLGAALAPSDASSVDEVLTSIVIAVERAAASGAGWSLYSRAMSHEIIHRGQVVTALRRAIENNLLELHYQPLVSLGDQQLVGAEALLRWDDAFLGRVSPAEFVALAEQHGMGRELDLWVTRAVADQIAAWRAQGLSLNGRIAINLSAARVADASFVDEVIAQVRRTRVSPEQLEVEITETTSLGDLDNSLGTLQRLKQAGFALAVDDFGTGYSSLAYLLRLPLDKVKIDIAFVRDMHQDPKALAIVRATLAMAHSLGMRSLAEGIESPSQRETLLDLGCQLGQGYHFARPLTADEFAGQWLLPAASRCAPIFQRAGCSR